MRRRQKLLITHKSCEFMKSKMKINVGDKAKVILNGEVKELEVVDVFCGDRKSASGFCLSLFVQNILGRGYLENIKVELPDGKIIECRPLQPMI